MQTTIAASDLGAVRSRRLPIAILAVGVTTAAIAAASARPYAGSWNDGSRLATVESLVDSGTLAIDGSVFTEPSRRPVEAPSPYTPGDSLLLTRGTQDKLFIGGRYYSDKPPVLSLLLAAAYRVLQRTSGLTARDRPDLFSALLTMLSSGIGYVAGAVAMCMLAYAILGSALHATLLTTSFALATVALPYTRHVNGHLPLLGVFCAMFLAIHRLAARRSEDATLLVLWAGVLSGVGYALDAGIGPILVVATAGLIVARHRRLNTLFLFVVGALPWIAFHHAVNYSVGGTIGPANRVVAYLAWPGSPFTGGTATGFWNHESVPEFAIYTLELLFGRRGFVLHNLPLLLAAGAVVPLLRRRPRLAEWPELVYACTLAAAVWLLYGAASSNYSGVAVSIRWFVPLLAPAFYVMALHLREHPEDWRLFLALSAWGAAMGWSQWWRGPWTDRMPPGFWVWVIGAVTTWVVVKRRQWRAQPVVKS